MNDGSISIYLRLLEEFLSKRIDADTFERSYLSLFKTQQGFLPATAFEILDRLFGDVDAYCADSKLRGSHDLDEEQLREKSAAALQQLRALESPSDAP